MELQIRHEPEEHRFQARVDGKVAFLDYERIDDDTLDYQSTFVPSEHRERGIGSAIVERALRYAEDEGYRVVPSCPFVKDFVERHPRFQDLITSK